MRLLKRAQGARRGASVAAALFLYPLCPAPAPAQCAPGDGGGTVAAVIDAGTLLLDDARVVRLSGVLPPRFATSFPSGLPSSFSSPGGIALDLRSELKTALAALVLGKRVRLLQAGAQPDRYGRMLAQVHVDRDGGAGDAGAPVWLQGALVEAGLTMADPLSGDRACRLALIERERQARERREGYWRNGLFAVRAARDAKLLLGLANTFQIVEGEVATAAEPGGRVYLNFGANYRDDFTATIGKQDRAAFADASGPLAALAPRGEKGQGRTGEGGVEGLKGLRLRIRGWIESHNGPMIAVSSPEQMEIAAPTAPGKLSPRQ